MKSLAVITIFLITSCATHNSIDLSQAVEALNRLSTRESSNGYDPYIVIEHVSSGQFVQMAKFNGKVHFSFPMAYAKSKEIPHKMGLVHDPDVRLYEIPNVPGVTEAPRESSYSKNRDKLNSLIEKYSLNSDCFYTIGYYHEKPMGWSYSCIGVLTIRPDEYEKFIREIFSNILGVYDGTVTVTEGN